MSAHDPQPIVQRALAAAKVRALRMGLLALHKSLLDAERRRYERANGRIESAQAALRLVLNDPWFQWLHPLAGLIVQMDERLDAAPGLDVADATTFADRVRALVQSEGGDDRFTTEYRRALQEEPDVVVAHGNIARLLARRD